jgi:polyhydroxybutyrate depolymerase
MADASQRDPSSPDDPDPAVVCPASALEPGDSSGTLTHDGIGRSFLVFVPESYDNTKAVPLVLNFHGGGSNATVQRRFSNMNPTANAKGFVVVYPQAVNDVWDAGACCSRTDVDDVGFARALVEYMKEHVCIDPRRVYSTGMSNGGRMTYRLGCEAADVFAAIAPVAGIKSFPDLDNTPGCNPSRPISLIDFQGTADTSHIRYQAGQIEEWVAFNGCTDAAPQESYRMGEHYCSTYSQCEAGTTVTFCVVPDGGHCWPGSYPCALGDTSMPDELSANDLMWELFARSTL